jgi:hypothetical protein
MSGFPIIGNSQVCQSRRRNQRIARALPPAITVSKERAELRQRKSGFSGPCNLLDVHVYWNNPLSQQRMWMTALVLGVARVDNDQPCISLDEIGTAP